MDNKEKPISIYEIAQIQAAHDILNRTDLYFHRKVCRWYSHQFHTPLHIVMAGQVLTWDEILTHYYEANYEKLSYNDLLSITKDMLPEIEKAREEADDEFIKNLIEADKLKKQSIAEKKQSLKKSPTKKQSPQIPPYKPSEEITKVFDVDESEEQ